LRPSLGGRRLTTLNTCAIGRLSHGKLSAASGRRCRAPAERRRRLGQARSRQAAPRRRSARRIAASRPPRERGARGTQVKVCSFQLMPYRELPDDFEKRYESVWVTPPNEELADPEKVGQFYNETLDELELADQLGFDGV